MARTDDQWEPGLDNTYIQTTDPVGYNLLVNGVNRYINFKALSGASGYGFRDNGGVMEFKNEGGAWGGIVNSSILAGYVPYSGWAGNVDGNAKQLLNISKLGVGVTAAQNTLDIVSGTAGVMNRGYYEAASIERDGDTKFGIYSSQNSLSGYAALTFGNTRYNTGGAYPGWEIQFMPGTSLATNKVRFNSLTRGASGVVSGANADIFTVDGLGNIVATTSIQTPTYYMNPARTIMMKYDGTYSPRLAFDATFNSDVYGGAAVVDYQEHLSGSAQKLLIFQMGRSGVYGYQFVGLDNTYGSTTLEAATGVSAFSGTNAAAGWYQQATNGGNILWKAAGGNFSWASGSQIMKLFGGGALWVSGTAPDFAGIGLGGSARFQGTTTDRNRIFLVNGNPSGSRSSVLFWLGGDNAGYGVLEAKYSMGNDFYQNGSQTFYLYNAKSGNNVFTSDYNDNITTFGRLNVGNSNARVQYHNTGLYMSWGDVDVAGNKQIYVKNDSIGLVASDSGWAGFYQLNSSGMQFGTADHPITFNANYTSGANAIEIINGSNAVRMPSMGTTFPGSSSKALFYTDVATAIANNYNVVCIDA